MGMSREEAISLLTQVNHILVNSNSWLENTHEPLNIAFDMAIKALEQEPITKNDLEDDAVSRQAINGYIDYILSHGMGKKKSFDFIKKFVANLPSVTPQEPRKGHWEHGKELGREYQGKTLVDITYEDWHCSNCHCVIEQSSKPKWSYCPNCGAKMDRAEREG
ncbi:hypothetical protein [Butyrivibrio sp. INlla21]|uniref:hypothetical protein n=1 Tax=Butyrivibrio sp. INlla21 TaxID=1520811 RepID=UPI0008EC299B|nr:hypothetical protein [Butyrivibrio sp. INlla21]SFU57199.1 hypothetical protein SAMN02910342_00931 [Butyrivibrio sp. INlla21]